MNLPKAFFTSRVTEALASLAVHVTSAQNIAASLKPIKTAALDLEEEEEPRPIITSIVPARITDSQRKDAVEFRISGKNLVKGGLNTSIQKFELFFEDDPSDPKTVFHGSEVKVDNNDLITSVVLTGAPFGSYEVRITDKNKTPHLPGFTVEIEADESCDETPGSLGTPPTIQYHPQWSQAKVGESASFHVYMARGTLPLFYQWLQDGKIIEGGTGDKYEISEVTLSHQGNYSVVVANAAGFVVSHAAYLTVTQTDPAAIKAQRKLTK